MPIYRAGRIKEIIEEKNLVAKDLETQLGYSNGALAKAIEDNSKLKQERVDRLFSIFPNLNEEWFRTGEGIMFNVGSGYTKADTGRGQRRSGHNSDIPFYNVDFEAGGGVAFYEDIRSSTPAYMMDVPDFAGCTAFRTYGKSMQPLIDPGAILFGTEEKSWHEGIEYGQIFGIVLHAEDGFTKRLLKRVRKSKEDPKTCFRLISVNPEYDEMELSKSKIKSMWLIHGWINKNT